MRTNTILRVTLAPCEPETVAVLKHVPCDTAQPPANVALGPGPGPDSATRPSRSRGSSDGETRRAPGPRPTSCEALDTWISLAGG